MFLTSKSKHITSIDLLSICLDKSTNVTGSTCLAIFDHSLVGSTIKEELINLASLKQQENRNTQLCCEGLD